MNDQQDQPITLQKLNQRLDKHNRRFDRLEELNAHLKQQLKEHDKRFDQQDKSIETLYIHMEERFAESDVKWEARFNQIDRKIDRLFNLLDEDIKRREVDDHDRLIMNHQLDQHDDWIQRASKELKIKYDRAA